MKFRTEIPLVETELSIQHEDAILSLGSCFAEHINDQLKENKFTIFSNPFGITYNPLSIADQLNAIRTDRQYDVVDLEKVGDHWLSFDHHGSFSKNSATEALDIMNASISKAHQKHGLYHYTILSLGTAWAWFLEDKVVNNCHQLPESTFLFRKLEIAEMVDQLGEAMKRWNQANPKNVFILTVSPVRHLRSGFIENNRSKARLIEVVHQLQELVPTSIYYPSYEILMDDLRDYRFYDSSLTHPSAEAIEYVWEHFSSSFFNDHTKDIIGKYAAFNKALWHRPKNTTGPAYEGHLQSLETKFFAWMQKWPDADWTIEKLRWNELLKMKP